MKALLPTTAALALAFGIALSVPAFSQESGSSQDPASQAQTQAQAQAQAQDAQGHWMHMHHHEGMGGMAGMGGGPAAMMQRMCGDREAHTAGMLAFAEKKLGITDAQRAAWGKFTDTVKASQQPIAKACDTLRTQTAPQTLPQRLERMETVMSARAAQFQQLVPAVKDMYGQLTPEQQKIADSIMPGHHG
jgi:hypothetical protein